MSTEQIKQAQDIYWDITDPLSFNAHFYIIMGNRGGGKSYGAKAYAIEVIVRKKHKKFAYVRRYKEELKDSANTFFNDLAENGIMDGCEYEYKGGKFYIDGQVVGYAFALSTAKTKKSMSFPDVEFIIFDEFILDPKDHLQRYLPTEVDSWVNLYETIARLRPVPAMLIGNTLSFTNPYFLEWNLGAPTNKRLIRTFHDGFILVQLVQKESFIKAKKETPFGRFMQNTKEGKYMIDNEVLRDNDNLVKFRPLDSRYLFTLQVNGTKYGVWYSQDMSIWVSGKHDPSWKIVYVTDISEHTAKTQYLKSASQSELFSIFVRAFRVGNLSFDNIKIKNVVIEAVRRCL